MIQDYRREHGKDLGLKVTELVSNTEKRKGRRALRGLALQKFYYEIKVRQYRGLFVNNVFEGEKCSVGIILL